MNPLFHETDPRIRLETDPWIRIRMETDPRIRIRIETDPQRCIFPVIWQIKI